MHLTSKADMKCKNKIHILRLLNVLRMNVHIMSSSLKIKGVPFPTYPNCFIESTSFVSTHRE